VVAAGSGTRTPAGTTGAVVLNGLLREVPLVPTGLYEAVPAKARGREVHRDGGYGQYELVHENIFFPVPDEFSATEATLLLDIMGTGGHAVERCQLMRPDIESLLVGMNTGIQDAGNLAWKLAAVARGGNESTTKRRGAWWAEPFYDSRDKE
jgi:threonine dehydrogenase-like Zn-dependent dehydrogenase